MECSATLIVRQRDATQYFNHTACLCRRCALPRRGDTPRLRQILRATKSDKLSDRIYKATQYEGFMGWNVWNVGCSRLPGLLMRRAGWHPVWPGRPRYALRPSSPDGARVTDGAGPSRLRYGSRIRIWIVPCGSSLSPRGSPATAGSSAPCPCLSFVRALARLRCAGRAHPAPPLTCVSSWDLPAVAVRCSSQHGPHHLSSCPCDHPQSVLPLSVCGVRLLPRCRHRVWL